MQSFAEQLNAVRKQRNITQEQLAERMNVSRTTISRWESGKIMPDLDTIRLLSQLLDYNFFSYEDTPAEEPADTCVREALEETGVEVEPVCLVSVKSSPYMVTYANGDQCQYMDLLFFCRPREDGNAQPRVADDESLEVGWFAPDALPHPLATSTQSRLELVQRFKQNAAQGNPACLFASTIA